MRNISDLWGENRKIEGTHLAFPLFALKGVPYHSSKSFDQTFSKVCAVEGAEPSSRSAEREIPSSAFLFANFFFAPEVSKKKWLTSFGVIAEHVFNKLVPVDPIGAVFCRDAGKNSV